MKRTQQTILKQIYDFQMIKDISQNKENIVILEDIIHNLNREVKIMEINNIESVDSI
jgi:hypothetical protein